MTKATFKIQIRSVCIGEFLVLVVFLMPAVGIPVY